MKQSELRPDTIGQLVESGTVFKSSDGRTLILGDTDTVAFQDDYGWQVAENVNWKNLEDADFDDQLLKRHARAWVHQYGSRTDASTTAAVGRFFKLDHLEAVRVVEHIENAVITID